MKHGANEFIGIDEEKVHLPKSFSSSAIDDQELGVILRGICKAWLKVENRNGIDERGAVTFDPQKNTSLIEFLIFFWLRRFNQSLSKFLVPVFERKSEKVPHIMGALDIIRFEMADIRGEADLLCTYNVLNTDIGCLNVIKDGYLKFASNISSYNLLTPEISGVIAEGLHLLKRVPGAKNKFENALRLRSKLESGENGSKRFVGIPAKLDRLTDAIDFFSSYIVHGLSGVESNCIGFKGIVFNLNYLLEYVLRDALRSLYTNTELQSTVFKNNGINRIQILKDGIRVGHRSMEPDCIGIFKDFRASVPADIFSKFENTIYIFDAKHKFFEDDDSRVSISREDFYQIVSYARSHYNPSKMDTLYGLLGLDSPKPIKKISSAHGRRYLSDLGRSGISLTRIDYDQDVIDVFQIPINFAQFCYDIGFSDDEGLPTIYQSLGLEILRGIITERQALQENELKK